MKYLNDKIFICILNNIIQKKMLSAGFEPAKA